MKCQHPTLGASFRVAAKSVFRNFLQQRFLASLASPPVSLPRGIPLVDENTLLNLDSICRIDYRVALEQHRAQLPDSVETLQLYCAGRSTPITDAPCETGAMALHPASTAW